MVLPSNLFIKKDNNPPLGADNSYTIVILGDQAQLVEITGKQLRLKNFDYESVVY